MHTDEQLADLPEALPLRRVSPFWLVLALLEAVALVGLFLVLCIVGLAALRQRVVTPAATLAVPVPPPAMPRAAFGNFALIPPPEDELGDPASLPYPVQEDLRQDGLPAEVKKNAADGGPSLRQRFLGRGSEVWQNPQGIYPSYVVIAPDGQSLALPAGDTLLAGPPTDVREIGEAVAGPAAAVIRPRMAPPGSRGVPGQGEHADVLLRRLLGVPVWSPDGRHVYVARGNGRLWRWTVGAQNLEPLPFAGDSPAAVPNDPDRLVFVRSRPSAKTDASDADATEVVLAELSTRAVTTVIPASQSSWQFPSVSWDGTRLAVVSDRGYEGREPPLYRVLVVDLKGGEPRPVSPPAAMVGPVCWTPDNKALVYARGQAPLPPEIWSEGGVGMYRSLDLFLFDLDANRETRLSRGGGNHSPSMTRDGELHYLTWQDDANGVNVRLRRVPLAEALAFAAQAPNPPPRDEAAWMGLVEEVLKPASLSAAADGAQIKPEALAGVADTFATAYRTRFQAAPPASFAALDAQRRELHALQFKPEQEAKLALALAAVEGEYLRRQLGARWALTTGPLQTRDGTPPTDGSSPFAFVVNPFLPAPHTGPGEGPGLLSDVLRAAAGRPLVLSNNPPAARATIVPDPELTRAEELFKQSKTAEAAAVLLGLMKQDRHQRNTFLALHVGRLLLDHGCKKELLELMSQQSESPPKDARKFNLLGLAFLLPREGRTDPEEVQQALDAFKNALRCDLHFGAAYLNLARAYDLAHDPRAARQCLLRYLRLMPRGPYVGDAHRRLAELADPTARP
jgi:tetratricopeptide (TPR) repeat protein